METPMLDFVIQQLNARRRTWGDIARDTGVPYSTIGKIARGEIDDPGVRKVEKLAQHFRLLERQESERAALRPAQQAVV